MRACGYDHDEALNLAIRLRKADKTAHDALIIDLNKICASHLFRQQCEVDIERTFSKACAALDAEVSLYDSLYAQVAETIPTYTVELSDGYGLIAKTATKRYAIVLRDGKFIRGHHQAETLDNVMRGAV